MTSAAKTELVVYTVQAEPLTALANVTHDPSFVTQLLANAAGFPTMPQRRRSDRAGPLAAYACAPPRNGRTRRMA